MIQWVYEKSAHARGVDDTLVATDDERVEEAVKAFGGQVIMTSPELQSGTDRVAAVADQFPADIYVNVQGDEPLMDPVAIERAVALVTSARFVMSTVSVPIRDQDEYYNRAVVKVKTDFNQRALRFTRELNTERDRFEDYDRHVGLYVYTRDTLMRFRSLPRSEMEIRHSLEQLRAMDDGIAIGVAKADFVSIGVDTPEELEKVRKLMHG